MLNSAVRLLDAAQKSFPKKCALEDENGTLSYTQYRNSALSVGTSLFNLLGEGGNRPVVVCMKKSKEMLVCFMGVLYSGNSYAPAAADIPMARLSKIVENLSPCCIICDDVTFDTVSAQSFCVKVYNYSDLCTQNTDEKLIEKVLDGVIDTDPIYMMYTSGSTGTPKGVTVSHRGVVDYVQWTSTTFGFDSSDIFANQAPFYFDNSIFDIYGALITGAKLILIPEALFMFPSKLPEFVRDNNVTVIFWVPTVMINVANSGTLSEVEMPTLKKVLFCGEVMPNSALNVWRKARHDIMYANLYGPTEITDVCTYYIVDREFEDHEPLPIGRPCENMRAVILTEDNKIAKNGEKGELCIGGTGVSLGYYNNPELSEKAFVQNPQNPFYHERLYRTGDIAYLDENGLIMYAGRRDAQIKIKGNRVELGEIETAAVCVDGIENACALFDAKNEKIVLFAESKEDLKLRKVNLVIKQHIPKYMLPGELVVLEKLPHTANDKIDRVTLRKTYLSGNNK